MSAGRRGQEAGVAGSPAELLRRVRLLELAARHNVAGLLAGDYTTAVPGRGMIFHEARKYVPGEPARRIDWNITARLGEPYVKVHLEERRRDVFIAIDVSPSMHSGFQERTKLEYAVELAATLALATIDGGDRLGWVTFADEVIDQDRPRGGRGQLFAALRAFLAATRPWDREIRQSDPRSAVHAIQRHRGGRLAVFLISDFIDHDLPDDLRYVQARHDVSLLHIYDPLEYAGPGPIRFRAYSPESDRRYEPLRPGDTGELREMTSFLGDRAGRLGISVASLSTARPVDADLSRFFHAKRRRVVR